MNIIRTPAQNKRLYQLLNDLGTTADDKGSMVYNFTDGRTKKSSEMTQTECNAMLYYLEGQLEQKKLTTGLTEKEKQVQCNTMRRKILSYCHQMGWYVRVNGLLKLRDGKPILSYTDIDKFCMEKGPYKKALQQHDYKELVVLVGVFEKVLQHEISKV